MRLTNRTPLVQTFLWWANVAVRVHDDYEAFFPPDVQLRGRSRQARHVHVPRGPRALLRRRLRGAPGRARPTCAGTATSRCRRPTWPWAPTRDFFGGYDHAAGEGYVHWADHAIAPGKKLWTWGDHAFGHAWDRELTDADGPYVELMAGVFTDNQPDFSFLLPGEVRTFRQYWYPIVGTGPVHEANLDVAVSLERSDAGAWVGVAATAGPSWRGRHASPRAERPSRSAPSTWPPTGPSWPRSTWPPGSPRPTCAWRCATTVASSSRYQPARAGAARAAGPGHGAAAAGWHRLARGALPHRPAPAAVPPRHAPAGGLLPGGAAARSR